MKNGLEKLMSRKDVMEYFGIGSTTLHRWVRETKTLPHIKIGGRVFFKVFDVVKLIDRNHHSFADMMDSCIDSPG
jgi:predicted site-specific integrase-resolvase